MSGPILLYDGVCGVCNRVVQFIPLRDHRATIRFAPLQSAFASRILTRHNLNPRDLDTIYVGVNPESSEEVSLSRSDAVLCVLKQLGSIWRSFAFLLQLLPRVLRDTFLTAPHFKLTLHNNMLPLKHTDATIECFKEGRQGTWRVPRHSD
jgi:predicted DCC family thiol-disulfide oxidoreductase YuxK